MPEYTPELELPKIPPKCEGCAVQCEAASRLMAMIIDKQLGESVAESIMGTEATLLDGVLGEVVPPEHLDEMERGLRIAVGDKLSSIDNEIEHVRKKMSMNEAACSGVLTMRASKGDVTYTVKVCTSPEVYAVGSSKPDHLPTHIQATTRIEE